MDYIINGGRSLNGEISVYGAKNCVLPLLAASVLTDEEVVLHNCPKITDVDNMVRLLQYMGKQIVWQDDTICVCGSLTNTAAPQHLAKLLRGSNLIMGSVLAKYGQINLPLPGGCAIGKRPMDIHLDGMASMGVQIDFADDVLLCRGKPFATTYVLRFPSVGATENLLCAAALAEYETVLCNCATEPEVEALERFLVKMGARIEGIGTPNIKVNGVNKLHGAEFDVIPDRIVTATYISAAVASGGEMTVTKCNPSHLRAFLNMLNPRLEITEYQNAIKVKRSRMPVSYGKVITAPYPFFPTDMQSLVLSLAAIADGGDTQICENLFENRLTHIADELALMGADIKVDGNTAYVVGRKLYGADVAAYDLRGGAALVIAGLNAQGITTVKNVENICRGYLNLSDSLRLLGADIVFK